MKIANKLTRALGRAGLQLQKHSPEILAVAGVVGVVASAVMACKATTKLSGIVDDAKKDVETIHNTIESQEDASKKHNEKKELAVVYTQTGLKIARLYAPAVTLGAASIISMLASNNILRKRNVALAAAYTTVDNGFRNYRSRVIERFGEELDKELKYNVKTKEVEEVTVNEKGEEKKTTKNVKVTTDNNGYSMYARCFEPGSENWEDDAEHNLWYLNLQQNHANELLRSKGHLFLNEVYDMLGIPRTTAGQIVGWLYDEKNPHGDNYVDFGIYDIHKEVNRNFVNGYEKCIWLDFNVDGPIHNLI